VKAKAFRTVHFANYFLSDFGSQRGLTDEQATVEAFGRFLYGENFIRTAKRIDTILGKVQRPPETDVTYDIVFWAERKA